MMYQTRLTDRAIISLSGAATRDFLQGLITNDIRKLAPATPLFAAMLSAQGKFQHDFFLYDLGDRILLDTQAEHKDALIQKLKRYRLRADVTITDESDRWNIIAHWGGEPAPRPHHYKDPRHVQMGNRELVERVSTTTSNSTEQSYTLHRLTLGIPDGYPDATERTFILENGYDALNGVSFDKGCYVGQEVTARMHYRNILKKCLFIVKSDQPLPPVGTEISNDGVIIGQMRSHQGSIGLALLRIHDALSPCELFAGTLPIRAKIPDYMQDKITKIMAQSATEEPSGD